MHENWQKLPWEAPGDDLKPSLSRRGHERLINERKKSLAEAEAEYIWKCTKGPLPPKGVPVPVYVPVPNAGPQTNQCSPLSGPGYGGGHMGGGGLGIHGGTGQFGGGRPLGGYGSSGNPGSYPGMGQFGGFGGYGPYGGPSVGGFRSDPIGRGGYNGGFEVTREDLETGGKVVVAVGTAYVVYRVVRFLPSLLPPLWPTIPLNAAVP